LLRRKLIRPLIVAVSVVFEGDTEVPKKAWYNSYFRNVSRALKSEWASSVSACRRFDAVNSDSSRGYSMYYDRRRLNCVESPTHDTC